MNKGVAEQEMKHESCKKLKNKSPFAAICNEMALKFDEADEVHDIDKTKALINEAKDILASHDEPAYAPLFYSVGTSLTIVRDVVMKAKTTEENPYTDPNVIKLHSDAIWYFRHAEELIDQIQETKDIKPYLIGIRLILYVNLGNALDYCGRKCSALAYYSKAVNLHAFGMALGNIGRCLEHYADLEGDSGHRAVLVKKAYNYYLVAEKADDPSTYQEAKDAFSRRRKEMESRFGLEALTAPIVYNVVETESAEEDYRHWCLVNHLFLNTLNDLPEYNDSFMTDPLRITSITTKIEQKNPPFVFEMFDQVKEEYIYSRYLLYEALNCNQDIHFADKETHLDDVLNYSTYSIRLEKLKTAFRTVYSLFDRIAFLLNGYLNLGLDERSVNFNRIWNALEGKEKQNIAIRALHWINMDFREKFGNSDTPHVKKLTVLRNALEHKFVSVHIFPVEKEIEMGEDFIYRISEDHLMACTMDLLKLMREAIIELTIAIRIEEYKRYQRNDGKKKIAHMEIYEYLDDFKR